MSKIDCSVNPTMSEKLAARIRTVKQREADHKPLRIDTKTVIYVPAERCNEEYAAEFRAKVGKCVEPGYFQAKNANIKP